MKTTDLIPLILYQLVDGDKYGYEIVKQIEDSSNGRIVIKQPTLYSVLKKLEQGKFISSYWQDSEIGGKRHYYTLTDNGKLQLSTYPPFDVLIREVLDEDIVTSKPSEVISSPTEKSETSVENPIFNSNNATEPAYDFTTDNFATKTFDITKNAEMIDNIPGEVAENEATDFSIGSTSSLSNTTINLDDFNNVQDEKFETTSDFNDEEDENEEYSPIIKPINLIPEQDVTTFNYGENSASPTPSYVNIFDAIEPNENENFERTSENTSFESTSDNSLNDDLNTTEMLQMFNPVDNNQPIHSFDASNEPNEATQDNSPIENAENEVKITPNNIVELEKTQESPTEFTKKVKQIKVSDTDNKLYGKLSPSQNILDGNENATENKDVYSPTVVDDIEKIKYLNYVDFATDKPTIKRRKAIKKHIIKCALTCATILIMLILSIVLGTKYEFSRLYYVCAIVCALVLIFYPIILLRNIPNLRLKYSTKQFTYSVSKDFFIKLSLFLSLVILIFAYNLNQVVDVVSIFKTYNFSNFITPIMFSFTIMLDFVYSVICYKKYRK